MAQMRCPKCGSEDISLYVDIPSLQFFLTEDNDIEVDIDDVYNAVERGINNNRVTCFCGDCNYMGAYSND